MKTAVCLFAFNRPKYLKRALETHKKIVGLRYYAFVDYSEKQQEVLDLVVDSEIYGEVVLRAEHYGLNRNITEGITEVFGSGFDAVIVLEDDLLLGEDGLEWLSESLEQYENEGYVGSVALHPAHIKKPREYEFMNLGWGTWKDRWERHEFIEGEGTQAQQFERFHRDNYLHCISSKRHKVKHIGWKGEHFGWLDRFSIRGLWRKYVS